MYVVVSTTEVGEVDYFVVTSRLRDLLFLLSSLKNSALM